MIDNLNIKIKENLTSKDLDNIKEDNLLIKKEIEEIKKVLPIAELKLPEEVVRLRNEREDIKVFLESLEMQFVNDRISKAEYEDVRKKNVKKLNDINEQLEKEWKNVERMLRGEPPETEQVEEKPKKKSTKKKKEKKKEKSQNKKEDRRKKILDDLKKLKV
jgi:hypothetical protein